MSRVVVDFVLLAYSAPENEGINEQGETRPPEVPFEQGFGSEASSMFSGGGVMYRASNGLLLVWGNIHVTFEV